MQLAVGEFHVAHALGALDAAPLTQKVNPELKSVRADVEPVKGVARVTRRPFNGIAACSRRPASRLFEVLTYQFQTARRKAPGYTISQSLHIAR